MSEKLIGIPNSPIPQFDGSFMDHLTIRKLTKQWKMKSYMKSKIIVPVSENKHATEIIGLWMKPYEFDDLAFKNAVYGDIKVNIKEVKRVR